MKAITLENTRRNDFINYCVKYRSEHDGSFLCNDDLNDFMPDKENPTCILIDNNDNIIGAASLLLLCCYLYNIKININQGLEYFIHQLQLWKHINFCLMR